MTADTQTAAAAPIQWQYRAMGEAALLVEGWPADERTNRMVQALAAALTAQALAGVVAVVPAINTVLVRVQPEQLTSDALQTQVAALLADLEPLPATPERVLTVPVRYGGADGPDLEAVAQELGLTPSQVVALHCGQVYRVMIIGFAPGFPYMGPLPDALVLPRRSTPRQGVPQGSVAIAAGMTGIYPAQLPGGWHLIGHTTLQMFDTAHDPPATLLAGDGVQFVALPKSPVQPAPDATAHNADRADGAAG